ncbi:MAG: hypothetical protein QOE93_1347, partial [Actinomycetota bacterium]|nr:hypothetical protein [Actinomycetota bacterium]
TSIVNTGVAGSTATSWLGVFSAGGQTSRIGFGAGWLPGGTTSDAGSISPLSSFVLTADGAEGSLPLDAGQFGVVASGGPATTDGRLEVTGATLVRGQASGRVKNTTRFPLDDVAIFVGTGGAAMGTLGPGEEREWTMSGTETNNPFEGRQPADFDVWPPNFDGFTSDDETFDFNLWTAAQELGGQEFRGPGEVVAAGWTRSFAPPVEVDGNDAGTGGRTLVLGRGRLQADSGLLDIRREVVRAPDFRTGRSDTFVVRFVTQDADRGGRAPDPARLTLTVPANGLDVESWHDGGWFPVDPTARLDLESTGWSEFLMPPSAVQGGVLYVRVPAFSTGIDGNGPFTLQERT